MDGQSERKRPVFGFFDRLVFFFFLLRQRWWVLQLRLVCFPQEHTMAFTSGRECCWCNASAPNAVPTELNCPFKAQYFPSVAHREGTTSEAYCYTATIGGSSSNTSRSPRNAVEVNCWEKREGGSKSCCREMAKYGECISGRPSYQTHRQTYYPAARTLNCEAEAGSAGGVGNDGKNSRSGGVGGQGARPPPAHSGSSTGTISQRDPVYPRSLAEEVLWRQRRFAWWGTTYLVDPVSVPPLLPPNPAHLKVQKILEQIRNKDVSSVRPFFL